MDSSNLTSKTTPSVNNPTNTVLNSNVISQSVAPQVSAPRNNNKQKLVSKLPYFFILLLIILSVYMGLEIAKKDFGVSLFGLHGEPEGDPVITVTLNSVSQSHGETILHTEHKGKQYPPIKLSADSKVFVVNSNDKSIRLANVAYLTSSQEINIFLTDRTVQPFIANRVYVHE